MQTFLRAGGLASWRRRRNESQMQALVLSSSGGEPDLLATNSASAAPDQDSPVNTCDESGASTNARTNRGRGADERLN